MHLMRQRKATLINMGKYCMCHVCVISDSLFLILSNYFILLCDLTLSLIIVFFGNTHFIRNYRGHVQTNITMSTGGICQKLLLEWV